ncbi:unnamed protein product [Mytilus coruscus]|uniref:Apple domain-containing protein n=1 Tax=Mytilus coruscus TaxID=42192 RepID=A0A6J8AUX0_MYTCO|nr:unnamed protein product [Mytilus coruscus]
MSKYEGLSKSAPEQQNCGLAVDVEYVDRSDTTRSLKSIECTDGTSMRSIGLEGSELKLKSKIIDGDFTRGYCMQISRDLAINTCKMNAQIGKSGRDDEWIQSPHLSKSFDECERYCLRTEACGSTTPLLSKDNAIYSQKQCFDNQKLKIKCRPPESTTQTSQESTTEDTFSTKFVTETKPIGDNHSKSYNPQSTIERGKTIIKDTSTSFLVALLFAVIGCTVAVFFAGTTVFYKRLQIVSSSPVGIAMILPIADMCTDDFATEENFNGSKTIDSVLLRITKQQTNCICHVSLQNNATNYTIFMSKYEGQSNAAPEQQNCGLAVDVDYVDTSDTIRSLQPIECTRGTGIRSIGLDGNELKLKTRIIGGTFTKGYCMQIFRNQSTNPCQMNARVNLVGRDDDWIQTHGTQHTTFGDCERYCLQDATCVAVHYESNYCFVYNKKTTVSQKDDTTYSQKHCVDSQNQTLFSCNMIDPQQHTAGTDGDWIETHGIQHTSYVECERYCLQTEACQAVHYEPKYCFVYNKKTTVSPKDDATYSQKHCVDTQKLQIRCFPPELTTQTGQDTTIEDNRSTRMEAVTTQTGQDTTVEDNRSTKMQTVTTQGGQDISIEDNRSTKMETATTPNSENPMTHYYSTMKIEEKKDMNLDLYVYVGAAAGMLILLLVSLIIVCIRKRSNQTYQTENQYEITMQTHNDNKDSDNDYDDLNGDYSAVKIKSSKIESNNDISLSTSEPVIKQKPNTYENVSL